MKFKKVVILALAFSLVSFSTPKRSEAILLAAFGTVTGGWGIAFYSVGGVLVFISLAGGHKSSRAAKEDALTTFLIGLALDKNSQSLSLKKPVLSDLVAEGYSKESAEKISVEIGEMMDRMEKEKKGFQLNGKSSDEVIENLMKETGLNKESAQYLASKLVGIQTAENLDETAISDSKNKETKESSNSNPISDTEAEVTVQAIR